ncbi:hypothetical protein BKA64DRAFT_375527 [Cadophora sp. MPI-SDFR-AT-0126]|nr:hypothetical protein BKA64DRAFT_375527 [Leotiomycetes sp. MPI-SDFR-AT-0126]
MGQESQSGTPFPSTSCTSIELSLLPSADPSNSPTFPLFPLLPLELRLQIFTHASSTHLHPLIHQIDTRRGTFISNQAPHPLLHTMRLSRATYLLTTSAVWAFGTYVSFSRDVFYFPHFARLENMAKLEAFLRCEGVGRIKRLAVKRELFDRAYQVIFGSTGGGGGGGGDLEGVGEGEGEGLVEMEELLMVWRDWRVVREAWWDKVGEFREVGEGELMGSGRENSHTGFLVRMCRDRYGGSEGVEGENIADGDGLSGGRRGVRIRLGVVE